MVYNGFMVSPRYFGGNRTGVRSQAASELMRFEIMKKGKLPPAERYKRIMKKKLEENKEKALGAAYKKPFSLSDKIDIKKLSPRAEQAMKEIAMKKARKLAKAERQMVIIEARNFQNGSINKKGEIFDIAGNMIGKVNTKNGVIATNNGWGIGKYKPKSMMTNMAITEAINKHSPYYINLRRQQMLQAQGQMEFGVHGVASGDVINVHGPVAGSYAGTVHGPAQTATGVTTEYQSAFGSDLVGTRQNVGVTAWGVRSDNVLGTFADNVWGATGDNAWGGYSSDVWGGTGGQGLWGTSMIKIWGTGNGVNYLKPITNAIRGLFGMVFGFASRKNRDALRQLNRAASASGRSSGAPSQAGRRR